MNYRPKSELFVITKAKDLCSYVFTITHKSPKFFRFSLVSRLQNLSLNIIEDIYKANEIFVRDSSPDLLKLRLSFQTSALTNVKLLSYFALLSLEHNCILPKHFEFISKLSSDCQSLLVAWIKSDKKFLNS